ncbi:SCO6745 family protein [Lentzea sp. HUAS TT2]|uniref:SCO6745 family protein n=1 Tax=Lentzea sp. HUAS TT2 TaxID=3447454 RepID=UPI003F724DEF
MDARQLWLRFEPYHDVTYFTPESRAATDALGCKGGWMGYFGMRAAPLGAASPELVTAVFYNFAPRMVHRALPDAWAIASPLEFVEARLAGVDGALRRLLGSVDTPEIAEAAELARAAALAAPLAGRPLAAANRALPWPVEPHLALWHACTILREARGDGHVAALVAAGVGPCQALALYAREHSLDPACMRTARGWTVEEWEVVADSPGDLLSVERATDAAALTPWEELGEAGTTRFIDLMTPLAIRIASANEAMRVNPMALDPVRELAVPGWNT